MKENTIILRLPLSHTHHDYTDVWIGVPSYHNAIYVGLQKFDGEIWYGNSHCDNKDRQWPSFIQSWYIATLYHKALVKSQGGIGVDPLLSKCPKLFLSEQDLNDHMDIKFVLQFLSNGQQDVEEVLHQLPPIEYIEKVVSLAQAHGLLFDSDMLRVFLEKYEEKVVSLTILQDLDHYDHWRKRITWFCGLCCV